MLFLCVPVSRRGLNKVILNVCAQVGSGGEAEEGGVVAAARLRLHSLHHQAVSVHPGQTRLPQLR